MERTILPCYWPAVNFSDKEIKKVTIKQGENLWEISLFEFDMDAFPTRERICAFDASKAFRILTANKSWDSIKIEIWDAYF